MKPTSAETLLSRMKLRKVYRRAELAKYSKAVERDLQTLIQKKLVRRAAAGLYYLPRQSVWGELPASPEELIRAFLNTDDFMHTSLNVFNSLGVGLTQMVNASMVYNRKRSGKFKLDGMVYEFKRPMNYPKRATEEYLYIDLLNNFDDLLEPPDNLKILLKKRLMRLSRRKLEKQAKAYGKAKAQRMLRELLSDTTTP